MSQLVKAPIVLALLLVAATADDARAQAFSAGSDGRDSELFVDVNQALTVPLPPDGILRCTTVTVSQGATLTFGRNGRNTPVQILSQGPIQIDGTIDVSGSAGTTTTRGLGGPGGFDGGEAGTGLPGGDGLGPGAGGAGTCYPATTTLGAGAYATRHGAAGTSLRTGTTYGTSTLIPLIGGSGGGGCDNGKGGSGGGGAILLASDVSITFGSAGKVLAWGGGQPRTVFRPTTPGGPGSGGAIRLVAPSVLGPGRLEAFGGGFLTGTGSAENLWAGAGRIRIDTLNRGALAVTSEPAAVVSSLMLAIPDPMPRLDIVHCAGEDIALDSGPVTVVLPQIAPATQRVTIRASGFTGSLPIRLRLVPEVGAATVQDLSIDMSLGDPAELDVNATFPANVRTRVEVFTR